MKDIFTNTLQYFRRKHRAARRYTAVLVVLALLTTLAVNWRLHQVGTALTTDSEYTCGYEEHVHTDECYTEELICGYEEGEPERIDEAFGVDAEPDAASETEVTVPEEAEAAPEPEADPEPKVEVHHHTADCYREVTELTCEEKEHTHDEACYDTETGELLCTQEEHTHDDSCYTTREELVCGYEEGEGIPVESDENDVLDTENSVSSSNDTELDEDTASDAVIIPSDDLVVSNPPVHHHTEACYQKVLTCTIPEHVHTMACLADITADVEGEDDWEKQSEGLSTFWNDALVEIAQKQLGYTESAKNFTVDEALGENLADAHHYTRYSEWYGNPYGEWDVMFVAFCQHYAGIPKDVIPQCAGLFQLRTELEADHPEYLSDGADKATPGDIVIYNNADGEETIGIVTGADADTLTVISGAVNGAVAEVTVNLTDVTNTISVLDAYEAYAESNPTDDEDRLTFDPDAVLEQEGAVAYIIPASSRSLFAAYDSDADAASSNLEYNTDGSLKLDNLLNSESISVKQTVGGADTWVPLDDETVIDDQTNVRVEVRYTVPNGAFQSGSNSATYTLPKGVYPKEDKTGYITDASDKPIGKFYLKKDDPTVRFEFNDPSNGFSGTFKFETKVSYEEVWETGKIQLGQHTYTIKPNYTMEAKKDGVLSADRRTISYTVKVNAPYGTDKETVTITDAFDLANSTATGSYQKDTLKINGKPLSDYPGASISYTADGSGFTITGLPALTYGEPTYTLTYDVAVDSVSGADGSGNFINNIAASSGTLTSTDKETITVKESSLTKTGAYDSSTHQITWTITVKNPGGDLKGYKLVDTLVTPNLNVIGNITVKDSKGTVVGTVSGSEFMSSGYTFPANSTDNSYTFTYVTNAPDPVNGSIYAENKATLEFNDFRYSSTGVVSVGSGTWGLNKKFSSITPLENGDQKITWDITGSVPAGLKNFQLIDIIRNHTYDSKYSDLYGISSEIEEAVKKNLQLTMEGGTVLNWEQAEAQGIQMTFDFYTDLNGQNKATSSTDRIQRFRLNFVRKDGTKLGILRFAISDVPTIAITADMENNTTRKFSNRVETWSDGSWRQGWFVDYDYKKVGSIEKVNSPDMKNYKSDNSTDYAKNKVIWYKITINIGDTVSFAQQTITDKIPDGMKLATDKSNFQIGFDVATKPGSVFTGQVSSKGTDLYGLTLANYTYYTIDASDPGYLTFKIFPEGQSATPGNYFDSGKISDHTITLRYALQLDDSSYWNDRTKTEKEYINTATWSGSSASSSMNIKRSTQSPLTKSGFYDAATHQANYTLIINPGAENLSSDDTLELTDEMSSQYFGGQGMELLLDSVKVYEYVLRDGEWVQGDEVINGCQVQLKEQTNSTRKYAFILPDEKALVLKYSYRMNTSALAGDLDVQNTALLKGQRNKIVNVTIKKDDASATINNAVLTVTKTDSVTNLAITSSPATFELSRYNKQTGAWDPLGFKTTTSGSFDLTFANQVSDGSGLLEIGDLYRLVETTAPTYYKLDRTPHYFIWSSTATDETSKQAALDNATGSSSTLTLQISDIQFFGANDVKRSTFTISNTQNVLTLRKVWYNTENDTITAPVDSIQVQLYRYKDGQSKATAVPVGDPITLKKAENWTKTDITLEDGYRYYVKELNTETGDLAFFEVKYSSNNNDGVSGGGEITITNKQRPSYELPSTGGTGTLPYSVVGGLLTAAAALLLARRCRKAQ